MLYAPTDIQSIHLPDGCGESHVIGDGGQLVLNCGPCEQAMARHKHLGFAASPELVTPTCDERAQAERDEASAQKAGIARLNAYANGGDGSTNGALAALVEQNTALMAQNAAMMQQIAALTAQVASVPPAPPPLASDVVTTVKVDGAKVAEAVKRRPGRPPTAKPKAE